MLTISPKGPYALKAPLELGPHRPRPLPLGGLPPPRGIPGPFLQALFPGPPRARLPRSQRGVKGGYSFARSPEDITVLEIVELLDGPLGAGAQGVFGDAAAAAREVLASTSVGDLVERERQARAPMYYI